MTYDNTDHHLDAEFERLDHVLFARAQQSGIDTDTVGRLLRVTPEEVDDPHEAAAAAAEEIEKRRRETDDTTLRFARLTDRFGLDRHEQDALLLALAPDTERRYERVFALLQGDDSRWRPSADTLVKLLQSTTASELEAMAPLTSASPLVTYDLLDLPDRTANRPFRARSVGADERIVAYLLGGDTTDPTLDGAATVRRPDEQLDDLPLCETTRDSLSPLAADSHEQPTLHYFFGPDEALIRRAVAGCCARTGDPVVRADATTVATDADRRDRILREAVLQDAAIHLENVAKLTEDQTEADADERSGTHPDQQASIPLEELVDYLDSHEGDVFLTGSEAWTPKTGLDGHDVALVEFPRPDYELRLDLWKRRADSLPDDVTPADLAGTFELTQTQIDDAIATARAVSPADGDQISRADLYRGCKAQSSARLDELAEEITPGYDWDDIMLPADTKRHLREVSAQITNRGTVYAEWGFEKQFSRGTGVVALFSGPSGTGKTMAAEVLANEAGLDLYRIDLSTVVSKYVGETEENLERIFDEAEQSSAVLLFDEADAIFGERSEVSDSNDRYANVEVNYLLQRIERYDGVVLLTTNYESNIDDAFLRRIHLHVEFPRPTEDVRRRIWEGMFPPETPLDDVDYEFLASLDLTGGTIRTAAQAAAFMAADEDSPVTMEHIVPAVSREIEKTGRLVDPSRFGDYREHLVD